MAGPLAVNHYLPKCASVQYWSIGNMMVRLRWLVQRAEACLRIRPAKGAAIVPVGDPKSPQCDLILCWECIVGESAYGLTVCLCWLGQRLFFKLSFSLWLYGVVFRCLALEELVCVFGARSLIAGLLWCRLPIF